MIIFPILVAKSLTAIDNSIIPKTFWIIAIPDLPNIRDIIFVDFSIIYTNNMLQITAIIILIRSNSALKESKVVKLPGPAIIGKAIGTIEAVSGISFLKYQDFPDWTKNNMTNE